MKSKAEVLYMYFKQENSIIHIVHYFINDIELTESK